MGEKAVDPMSEISLAALILALAAGYFLVSRVVKDPIEEHEKKNQG